MLSPFISVSLVVPIFSAAVSGVFRLSATVGSLVFPEVSSMGGYFATSFCN